MRISNPVVIFDLRWEIKVKKSLYKHANNEFIVWLFIVAIDLHNLKNGSQELGMTLTHVTSTCSTLIICSAPSFHIFVSDCFKRLGDFIIYEVNKGIDHRYEIVLSALQVTVKSEFAEEHIASFNILNRLQGSVQTILVFVSLGKA